MANTVIKHDPSTAGSNRYKYTISGWFKRTTLADRQMFLRFDDAGGGYFFFEFKSDDTLGFNDYDGGSSGRCEYVITSKKFRDPNAYYNIILTVDSTQVSSSDRVKIWVNGELQSLTSNGSEVCPSNYQTFATSGALQYVGGDGRYATRYYGGVISHLHFCEGYAYDETDFGSTDSTTGEWKINTSPSVSYGTNGFFLFKDDNSLTDRSGQNNNFSTHSGTLTKTEDNPSNVFATCNPLHKDGGSAITFTNGNTTADVGSGNDWCTTPSTLGATSGKFYFEAKLTLNSNNEAYIGVANQGNLTVKTNVANYLGIDADSIGWYSGNGDSYYNVSASSYGNSWTTGDIVGCAIDIDNSKLYFSKNGTWQNSGDPTSGSTGTGAAYSVTAPSSTNGGAYFFCGADLTGANNVRLLANFGNGIFADNDPVASAGTNASGIGIFEYNVPAGFTALSTKGLNE